MKQLENAVQIIQIDDMDWFQVYWQNKRSEYFDDREEVEPEKLKEITRKLESDIASFWKFRARNTLRLM